MYLSLVTKKSGQSCFLKKSLTQRKSFVGVRQYSDIPNEAPVNPFEAGTYRESIQYCFDSVKKVDYPNYFCSTFLDKETKISVLAIRAFNIEIASIKSSKSFEASRARMEWWKESIKSIYKNEYVKHPVLLVLREVILKKKLSQTWFLKVLDARMNDLSIAQPKSLDDLVDYSEATASSLLYLALESGDIRNIQADHAASHLGKAIGLTTILKALPYHSLENQVYVPIDLTLKHNVSAEQFIRKEITQEGRNLIYEIANIANQHLEFSRELINEVPEKARPILLPAGFCDDYLKTLMSVDFDPFDPRLMNYRALTRPKIAINYLKKKF